MATSFVYVVGPTSNPVKIGYTEDVASRICQLQIGNPDELTLFKAIPVPWALAGFIETSVHDELRAHRRRGEWFDVDAEIAIATVISVATRIFEERQADLERDDLGRDLWARLNARFVMHADAEEASQFYVSERKISRDNKAVKTMNRYILQEAGTVALGVFQQVVLEGRTVEYVVAGNRIEIERGYTNLAKAVNALAEYYSHRKRVQAERLWGAKPAIAITVAGMKSQANAQTAAELREETRRRRLASQTSAIGKKPAA